MTMKNNAHHTTTEETTFDRIRNRPRFKMHTDLEPEEFEKILTESLGKHPELMGNINREVATIQVKTPDHPFWKPNLALRTEKDEGNTVIRGIFGPNGDVWTLVMFLYFLLGISWMVLITLWFVGRQINSTDYTWALPVSIGVLVLIALLYFAVRMGHKKAEPEMRKLRDFVITSTLKYEKSTETQM